MTETQITITTTTRRIAREINSYAGHSNEWELYFDADGRQIGEHEAGQWYAKRPDWMDAVLLSRRAGRGARPRHPLGGRRRLGRRLLRGEIPAGPAAAQHRSGGIGRLSPPRPPAAPGLRKPPCPPPATASVVSRNRSSAG